MWYLNGQTFAELGIYIASGDFRTHGASTLTLRSDTPFDDTPLLNYDDTAVITYLEEEGGTAEKFFQGKCVSNPRHGSAAAEGQTYEIADAWAELERTIYQEKWGYMVPSGLSAALDTDENRTVPRMVFGMDETGLNINVGSIIQRAIDFAKDNGVDINIGSIPGGEFPFHVDMTNTSCAEIIRTALRLHPDWIPWINHTLSSPTLQVTPIASMGQVTHAVDGTGDFDVEFDLEDRADLLPKSVRVCYEYAFEAENPTPDSPYDPAPNQRDVFRRVHEDIFPTGTVKKGPGVLCTLIPLQGMSEQRQKSRIWARTIPEDKNTPSETVAKEWFKAKYPHLVDVPIEEFTVESFDRELIMEWEGDPENPDPHKSPPPPINPEAKRIDPETDLKYYPRELYKGTVEDWMRRRVGRMRIKNVNITAAAGASAATKKAIATGFQNFTIVATNAVTKVYVGPSQWAPEDKLPVGIAQALYESIQQSSRWQGTVTVTAEEIPRSTYLGKKLQLDGFTSGYTPAPITAASWDIASGTMTLSVGPSPYLAPVDFIELQRILRAVPVSWWNTKERDNTQGRYGCDEAASAGGDSVGGFHAPETVFEVETTPLPFTISIPDVGKIKVSAGRYQSGVDGSFIDVEEKTGVGSQAYLCIKQNSSGVVDAAGTLVEIVSSAKTPTNLDSTGKFVEWSNVIIGEVVDNVAIQRRHGNFILTLWDINGYAARWPETVIGSGS